MFTYKPPGKPDRKFYMSDVVSGGERKKPFVLADTGENQRHLADNKAEEGWYSWGKVISILSRLRLDEETEFTRLHVSSHAEALGIKPTMFKPPEGGHGMHFIRYDDVLEIIERYAGRGLIRHPSVH